MGTTGTDPVEIREYPVHPALAPYVKCVWSLESAGPIRSAPREGREFVTCSETRFRRKR